MKFSDSTDYLAYIDAKARSDLPAALKALRACLKKEEFKRDRIQHAHLLQIMGDVYFENGKRALARRAYEKAELVDPKSLLFKYYFAVFLIEKISDPAGALRKCEEIVEIAKSSPMPESQNDFGSTRYVRLANRLKKRIEERTDR